MHEIARTSSTNKPASDSQAPSAPGTKRRLSKTHLDYWRARIKRPFYTRAGVRYEAPNFSVELQHQGKRRNWSLGTPNRDAAAGRSKEIYLHLVTNGWEATIGKFRPRTVPERKIHLTVGEFIAEVKHVASGRERTIESYAKALRKIVSDVFPVSTKGSKLDRRGGGHARWLEAIHSRRLAELTPQKIQEWKRTFIARAGTDPIAIRSARTSANTFLGCAKSLFSRGIIRQLTHIELPSPLPFEGVEFEPRQSKKYYSRIQVPELIAQARTDLAQEHPEVFKIFLLALFTGLRRSEIDLLEWPAFRWDESALGIEPTKFFHPKSEDSIGVIPIEAELLEVFRGYRARASGPFVIESDQPPRLGATFTYYRCQEHFAFLIAWLRKHGIDNAKPLHTLRKEFGSQLCAAHGIYAASRGLRHADIAITSSYYTDSKARAVVGLGHLLAEQKIVPLPVPEKKVRKQPNRSRSPN